MAANLIQKYSQQKGGRIEVLVLVVNKEKYVYKQIELNFFNEVTHFLHYARWTTTEIPNNFKFFFAPQRTMYVTTMQSRRQANILDLFPDLKKESNTTNMWIHVINKPFTIYMAGTQGPIHMEKHSTLEITNSDGRERQIAFHCGNEMTLIVVEVLYPSKCREMRVINDPNWTYNVNTEDLKAMKSFVRLALSPLKENNLTLFVNAHCATLKESLKPAIVAITVLNYEGELIMNSIITPRNPVKHYQQHSHRLTEQNIRNQWDSEEFENEARKILDGRIVVGIMVKDLLENIKFPESRILGIRDLGNAKCLEKKLIKCAGHFRISYLKKELIPGFEPVSSDLQSEIDARTIREIYLKIRDSWEDHIKPNVSISPPKQNISINPSKSVPSQTIPKKVRFNVDEELGPPPAISLQEEEESVPICSNEVEIEATTSEEIMDKEYLELYSDTDRFKDLGFTITKVVEPSSPELEKDIKTEDINPIYEDDNYTTYTNFDDLDDTDPIYWRTPSEKWKPRIDFYDGKKVNHTALFEKGKIQPSIKIGKDKRYTLSSMVYTDDDTGEPVVISYRYGASNIYAKLPETEKIKNKGKPSTSVSIPVYPKKTKIKKRKRSNPESQ